jgi:hypothetical protein
VTPESLVGITGSALQELRDENARLREALNSLKNEAKGFLGQASALDHGHTNMNCLSFRIQQAELALSAAKAEE